MKASLSLLPGLCLALMATTAHAEFELAPSYGFRMGGSFDVRDSTDDTRTRLDFEDAQSLGLALDIDLDEAGKQTELYFGRQETTAYTADTLLTPARSAVDLTIYQLQLGGLYFPGGKTTGGYVSGVAGVTRLEPVGRGLRNHHRASITLGGGYKIPLTRLVLLRLDLRAIYTALNVGGSVFCSGGCIARFDSNGYVQTEASVGLSMRFNTF